MDLHLHDKVALITGGSSGIGLAVATRLAEEGARVAVTARDAPRAQRAASAFQGYGRAFESSDLDSVPDLISDVEAQLGGPIDIYVANTGGPPSGTPLGFTPDEWTAAHRTLVLSPMTMLQHLLPEMRARGWGRVVAIGSSASREPIPSLQLSNAHRPGLVAAFKVLAQEAAGDGVTLNTLLPGRIATDRLFEVLGSEGQAQAFAEAAIPARRLGTVEEAAAAVAFLCSTWAAYITGTTLLIDGGLSASV